jgi:hypothetical protein
MSDVSQEFFSTLERTGAINALIHAINGHLPSLPIQGWKKWRVIFIIVSDDMKCRETRRLTRRDMALDFRVHIDYEAARRANFSDCVDLIVPALEKTLPYFKKAGIGKDLQDKIRDCVRLAAEETKAIRASKH